MIIFITTIRVHVLGVLWKSKILYLLLKSKLKYFEMIEKIPIKIILVALYTCSV